ncbi:hypothetical protein N7510_009700 [Penicillium lagena]|uniref:uncharacterized protein n=1 Tax=Penicillium lagena TaxID=94218 RepID=UPI0025423506|nr:uncharacterized protein N7510_009700 [Penicillium lagena]KAJ5604546.1 hypothetical protein N7510_009700 [Penicillium lagena]
MAISVANSACSPVNLLPDDKGAPPKQSMWHRLGLRRWLGRDDREESNQNNTPRQHLRTSSTDSHNRNNLTRRLSRRVGVGLPRSTTFKRQNSERRDRLQPLDPDFRRPHNPQAWAPRQSAPEVQWADPTPSTTVVDPVEKNDDPDWDPCPDVNMLPPEREASGMAEGSPITLGMELEHRWILNLSMHFRDRSEREKFFVTYAETPNRWRRVTISCDYRGAEPDSLEQDLKQLRYQRDKCARVYESIRESLPDIQFYDTVTNLKVETRDGRLHVHVTEDVNEIIPYPPISSIGHLLGVRCVPEHHLHFEAHLSGFVYKVRLGEQTYIKKEIPGPDTVDEFLYEINALHALNGSPSVVRVEGIVVDERQEVVKGLLISHAEQGALVDLLYEQRGTISFARRERWANQIVQGLCEIHESGYVQGDFTLSNIVVDGDDNAKIIDINRRGCPVGWEPPEIAVKIESNQRISMYIGVKTDLYQLGMTLWALAMEEDEPERQPRPLLLGPEVAVPDYYRRLVEICLNPTPRHRLSAKELLSFFPPGLSSLPPIQAAQLEDPLAEKAWAENDIDAWSDLQYANHAPTPNGWTTVTRNGSHDDFANGEPPQTETDQPPPNNLSKELTRQSSWTSSCLQPASRPSHSPPSLLLSALPINPAQGVRQHELSPAMKILDLESASAGVCSRQISSLFESQLPINPDFKGALQ